ncbi:hypothetical protein OSB04_016144 [Centaurea solstitialis]|uniref:Uncharacterized protein n=1 Tax=Centaurea solstitialis TaxID=347529 RepID=A0AA38T201_9ASTR|nr:hypothetical protein OSB04_016144 [Centaurea solstitialis]
MLQYPIGPYSICSDPNPSNTSPSDEKPSESPPLHDPSLTQTQPLVPAPIHLTHPMRTHSKDVSLLPCFCLKTSKVSNEPLSAHNGSKLWVMKYALFMTTRLRSWFHVLTIPVLLVQNGYFKLSTPLTGPLIVSKYVLSLKGLHNFLALIILIRLVRLSKHQRFASSYLLVCSGIGLSINWT